MPKPDTVSFTNSITGEKRTFPIDLSFEPYRREAFRSRSNPSQRQGIAMTNIPGEGTVATDGPWRREQVDWSMGAGQYSLDRKGDDQPNRFFSSKGIDVFSFPLRAQLLPATGTVFPASDTTQKLLVTTCAGYLITCSGGIVSVNSTTKNHTANLWTLVKTMGANPGLYGGISWTTIYSITANDTYFFIATDTGIWFGNPATDSALGLYAANDEDTPFTNGYTLVRWCNDQVIAANGARLYAFQPRSATSNVPFGAPPASGTPSAFNVGIASITNTTGIATVTMTGNHGLKPGQRIAISGSNGYYAVNTTPSLTGATVTLTTYAAHGLVVGQRALAKLYFNGGSRWENIRIASVTSNTVTYNTNKLTAAIISTGYVAGLIEAIHSPAGAGYNKSWFVDTVPALAPNTFTIVADEATYGTASFGGRVGAAPEAVNSSSDVLITHSNPNWVWSDATGGMTQIYFAGYVHQNGQNFGGRVYRSDLLGSSTSQISGTVTITTASVNQPWVLDTPVQALPLSVDEYPTCLYAFLNYIFVGTNRGVRMAQTLSVYDPTATATGDLKSGPYIPNILQPITYPITAIIGSGPFVWFSWNFYGSQTTGLGRLDLRTFIGGDPMTPAYASDLMIETTTALSSSNIIDSMTWDTVSDCPAIALRGYGVYEPYASNYGQGAPGAGACQVGMYVPSGEILSSVFDYNIPDPKIPVEFDYGVYLDTSGFTSASAVVTMDPYSPQAHVINSSTTPNGLTNFTSNNQNYSVNVYNPAPNGLDRAREFQVQITLSTVDTNITPYLHRWTLKAYPAIAQNTTLSAVLRLFEVSEDDTIDTAYDVYNNFVWLENLRVAQTPVLYQEGYLSVYGQIDQIDRIPHKADGTGMGSLEGDVVVYIKTITPFEYNPPTVL